VELIQRQGAVKDVAVVPGTDYRRIACQERYADALIRCTDILLRERRICLLFARALSAVTENILENGRKPVASSRW
jgi:hypothetical protein